MSSGAFQASCVHQEQGKEITTTLTASPELPQATLRFNDEPTKSLNVVAVTPLEIRIELHRDPYSVDTLVIDRRKAEMRSITTSGLDGGLLSERGAEDCTFKSL